jgi:DNA processing protein
VFAVPGEIGSALSVGTNALLKLGAAPLTDVADVLDVYGLAVRSDPVDDALLAHLPATVDELVRATGRPVAAVTQALTELELSGHVTTHDGVYRA